jgi:hypothetical protein
VTGSRSATQGTRGWQWATRCDGKVFNQHSRWPSRYRQLQEHSCIESRSGKPRGDVVSDPVSCSQHVLVKSSGEPVFSELLDGWGRCRRRGRWGKGDNQLFSGVWSSPDHSFLTRGGVPSCTTLSGLCRNQDNLPP